MIPKEEARRVAYASIDEIEADLRARLARSIDDPVVLARFWHREVERQERGTRPVPSLPPVHFLTREYPSWWDEPVPRRQPPRI
jgi:hypothetical protein